jgi:hypothetical protein
MMDEVADLVESVVMLGVFGVEVNSSWQSWNKSDRGGVT